MASETTQIAVLGAGSWGTALAVLMARNGHAVRLWTREAGQLAVMQEQRGNPQFLPGIGFPENLQPTSDLDEAVAGGPDVLVAIPSHGFGELMHVLAGRVGGVVRLAWATKGLESGSGRLLSEAAREALGESCPLAVVSGPTFAAEVACGHPTAITVASTDADFSTAMRRLLHSDTFRVYTSDDIIGVQVGGALKNIMAIAAGIADGLGYGANTRAALVTRGLAEICRFGAALGGRTETLIGLAGLGDLVLTCTDDQSRNRRFGMALARGTGVADAQAEIGQIVEGVFTAGLVVKRAAEIGVEMPITEQVVHVLDGDRTPDEAVRTLLARQERDENG